jgi:hypothetical protein
VREARLGGDAFTSDLHVDGDNIGVSIGVVVYAVNNVDYVYIRV